MGKMERKCNWRPLICLGLRALMKPLLPGCRPPLLPPQHFASSDAQGKAAGAGSAVKAAFLQHSKTDRSQENRLCWALERSLVFRKLCFCGLLPCCTHKSWQPACGRSGRSNSMCVFERVSSSCLNGEGKSNTVLGDSWWQNDNFRVTFIRNLGWDRENTWELVVVQRNFYQTSTEQSKSPT